jgi:hypothetical protein
LRPPAPQLNVRQRRVLRAVERDPELELTIASHQRAWGVAFATARADLLDLARRGLLAQRKVGKRFVFMAAWRGTEHPVERVAVPADGVERASDWHEDTFGYDM